MKLHYIKHVPFEGLGSMEDWFSARGDSISCTAMYENAELPDANDLDMLIVMGGPMGIYDYEQHPWLMKEKAFIRSVIDAEKIVLGVCLGAQLIADVLGGRVSYQGHREIGWFPVQKNPNALSKIAHAFPEQMEVFHWHGDSFQIPDGAERLASSEACVNQSFVFDDRVLGLQFHCETTINSAKDLIEACTDELDGSPWVQNQDDILREPERFIAINQLMDNLLEILVTMNQK